MVLQACAKRATHTRVVQDELTATAVDVSATSARVDVGVSWWAGRWGGGPESPQRRARGEAVPSSYGQHSGCRGRWCPGGSQGPGQSSSCVPPANRGGRNEAPASSNARFGPPARRQSLAPCPRIFVV